VIVAEFVGLGAYAAEPVILWRLVIGGNHGQDDVFWRPAAHRTGLRELSAEEPTDAAGDRSREPLWWTCGDHCVFGGYGVVGSTYRPQLNERPHN
jgi:hypothetical protein